MLAPLALFAVIVDVCGFSAPYYRDFPLLIPATQRHGHRYHIEVDNIENNFIFKSIAVLVKNKEVIYGEYNETSGCARFAPTKRYSSILNICHNKFFLLTQSFQYLQRLGIVKRKNKESGGDHEPLFANAHLALIKDNVADYNSPKLIGTYSTTSNKIFYIRGGKRLVISGVNRKIGAGLSDEKVELVCRVAYKQ
ncbi:hypothetical protein Q1695_010784 [Nippostrongylus brasiliensis]|nr:hypothetical protein Q1695_010784 [Nippostrongylus brasiliensis]